jgi:hypothetical protein
MAAPQPKLRSTSLAYDLRLVPPPAEVAAPDAHREAAHGQPRHDVSRVGSSMLRREKVLRPERRILEWETTYVSMKVGWRQTRRSREPHRRRLLLRHGRSSASVQAVARDAL